MPYDFGDLDVAKPKSKYDFGDLDVAKQSVQPIYPDNSIGNLAGATAKFNESLTNNPIRTVTTIPYGVGEAAAQLGTGIGSAAVGGLKGLYTGAKSLVAGEGMDAATKAATDAIQRTEQAGTYQPQTASGKYLSANLIAPFEAAKEIGKYGGGYVGGLFGEKGRLAGESIGNIAPDVAATILGGRAAMRGAPTVVSDLSQSAKEIPVAIVDAAKKAQEVAADTELKNSITDTTNKQARDVGYNLTPSSAGGGAIARAGEGLSGSARMKQANIVNNQPLTNKLMNETLGIPESTPLSEPLINGLMSEKYKSGYEPIKQLGNIKTDNTYRGQLADITKETSSALESFPNDKTLQSLHDKLQNIANGANENTFDANAAILRIKQLRSAADSAFKGDKPDVEAGRANRAAAQAIEDQIERHLNDKIKSGEDSAIPILDDYRNARQYIAQANTIKKALVGSDVNANRIGADYVKNKGKFSGNLELVGKLAETHGDQVRLPRSGDANTFTATDAAAEAVGLGSIFAANEASGGHRLLAPLAALPFARVGTRALLGSDFYQKNAAPSYTTPIADLIAGKREVPPVETPPVEMTNPSMQEFIDAQKAAQLAANNEAGLIAGKQRGESMLQTAFEKAKAAKAYKDAQNEAASKAALGRAKNLSSQP